MTEIEKHSLYEQAAHLRLQGLSYNAVGKEMGISPITAKRYIQKKLDAISSQDAVEQLRDEHYAKYMDIIEKHYPRVEKSESAAYLVLRTMKHIEDLYGMKAPHRIDIRTQEISSKESEQLDEELAKYFKQISDRQTEALEDDIIEGEIIEPPK